MLSECYALKKTIVTHKSGFELHKTNQHRARLNIKQNMPQAVIVFKLISDAFFITTKRYLALLAQ